jgi:hypothetical protein
MEVISPRPFILTGLLSAATGGAGAAACGTGWAQEARPSAMVAVRNGDR